MRLGGSLGLTPDLNALIGLSGFGGHPTLAEIDNYVSESISRNSNSRRGEESTALMCCNRTSISS
jgi:hypothetical protein